MSTHLDHDRRYFLHIAALGLATAPLVLGRAAHAQGVPGNAAFASLKQINAGLLNVGYAEDGPVDGPVVILLHGWPYDIHSFVDRGAVACKGRPPRDRSSLARLRHHALPLQRDDAERRTGCTCRRHYRADGCTQDRQGRGRRLRLGARTANIMAALWPERLKAMVSVSGYLIGSQEAGKTPLPPKAELQWWYQYYFATERGRAGYAKNTHDFAKLIWQLASPKWNFDDATFNRSAASLDNPDHVDISIHNYRWRLGLAEGEAKYAELEKRLAEMPAIMVPTITIEGDANGAPHPDPASYAKKFSGKYLHLTFSGGIGHNPPQEAPQQFAEAVLEAARM